jgi:chromosome segregation protein
MPYIKKMHLSGFKSFAKPVDIIFQNGLNVIVGPNGAGKSNLADAICFVLGRLKVRSMRATKSANLIYHGGKEGKPAQNAKVSMVFDNSDGVFSIQSQEVEIMRIVKKDGTSVYKINGETKTRQEMLELMAQADIDPEGFNIILQTEISNIIQMHPEEKRQIIEEIAGISIYETRKEKSINELRKTEDKLKEVKTILNERAAYMRNLEKEKAQAEKYEQLKRNIRFDRACLRFKQVKEKRNEFDKIVKQIDEKKELVSKAQQKINAVQGKIISTDKQIQEINEHIEKSSGVEQSKLFQEMSELRSSSAVLSIKLENYKEQLSAIDRRVEQLKADETRITSELVRLEQEKVKKEEKEGVDIGTFKSEVLKASREIKETGEKLTRVFSAVLEKIKERKNVIDDFIRQNKIKQVQEEVNALVYSLEESLDEFNTLAKTASNVANSMAKLKIGEEEKRNIALEIELAKKELERIKDIVKKSALEKKDFENLISSFKEDYGKKKKDVEEKEKLEKKIRSTFDKMLLKKSQLQGELKKQEIILREEQSRQREIEGEVNTHNILKARIDAESEVLEQEVKEYEDIRQELEKANIASRAELEARIDRNERALQELGSVNLRALEVYDAVKKEYDEIDGRVKKLEEEKQEILKIIEEVDKKKRLAFMTTFNAINVSFSENFNALDNKGRNAFLELESKEDPFAGGMDIIIKIAKGKYQDADSLSGGEKVIAGLALIFAIQKYKPYCFYIFDEIDPALDKRNSEKLATILKENIRESQCIIITHNDAIINQADVLYGASMQEGISKVISLKV